MRKLFTVALVLAVTFTWGIGSAFAGNGLDTNGAHYNLNIIGVKNTKGAEMSNNGHRIFVALRGTSKIWLSPGPTFQVIDANGTDSDGAEFQLPNPDSDNDGETEYSVFARALGKPGEGIGATMTLCAYDGPDVVCSTENKVFVREKGTKSSFTNVSRELLYLYYDGVRYNLFNDEYEDYFWQYDNRGLKLLQLRFYDISTNVNE